jgi:hypothetical protein
MDEVFSDQLINSSMHPRLYTGYIYNSLKKFKIDPAGITLKVSEIVDARKDKKVVGIIQLGLKNRKDLAVFEKPGLEEVEELLDRSNLILKEKGLVMRISKLRSPKLPEHGKKLPEQN